MDTATITLLIALAGIAITAASFFIGRQSAAKNSGQEWGAFTAELKTDVSHIKEDISEIKAQVKLTGEQYSSMRTDVEVVKRDLKTAFNKIDDIKTRGT